MNYSLKISVFKPGFFSLLLNLTAFLLSWQKFFGKESPSIFIIDFYETDSGYSPVRAFLDELDSKKDTVKDARIQFVQVSRYIDLLSVHGTTGLSTDIAKHIEDEIWELRPGKNRVFFFYYRHGTYVLLHHYVKKTDKTPPREIERAKSEMNDHIRQKEKKR